MEVKIVIPSHGRADRVTTIRSVSDPILCVAESQVESYREHNDCEIVVHPDDVVGLNAKRDWICAHFGDVMMLDDDITFLQRQYEIPATCANPVECREIIQATAYTASQLGVYVFGFATVSNPTYYRGSDPFRLTGFCNGCGFGLLKGSKVKFTHRRYPLVAVEDFYASLLNAYYHRMAFFDMRFAFHQTKTFRNVGGQALFRTSETEKESEVALKWLFGNAVISKKNRGRAHVNVRGVEMKLPF